MRLSYAWEKFLFQRNLFVLMKKNNLEDDIEKTAFLYLAVDESSADGHSSHRFFSVADPAISLVFYFKSTRAFVKAGTIDKTK